MNSNKCIKVHYASKMRGFIRHIIENPPNNVEYTYSNKNFYETSSNLKLLFRKIFLSKLGDILGLIQKISVNENNSDFIQTYNRFIKNNKKYIITLENPTALYHYSLNRNKTILGRTKIKKELNRGYLKAIVCISKACYTTANKLITDIPEGVKLYQIYPYIPSNEKVNKEYIIDRSNQEKLKCLYISSDFNLKSGREIIKAFESFNNDKLELTIITDLRTIMPQDMKYINEHENIKILDFTLNYNQLKEIYSDHMILLHPTRQDSFALVVLEAIKSGMMVIGTDLYAIPEMVVDNYNGYLIEPKYRFFKENNMPNEYVWNNREETIYSNYIDENIVDFLRNKINYIYNNREKLIEFSLNSYELATKGEFSEEYIKKQWEKVYQEI